MQKYITYEKLFIYRKNTPLPLRQQGSYKWLNHADTRVTYGITCR
nr:MAG TPA: hypothetical protein [Caudoviricetes sp.]